MLDKKLWTSFIKGLSPLDVDDIEGRIYFLKDALEEALEEFNPEEVPSDLDRDLHIYLAYFDVSANDNLSPWLIHDAWLYYYDNGNDLTLDFALKLKKYYLAPVEDLYNAMSDLVLCIGDGKNVKSEGDAVLWLSLLDYLVTRLIVNIGSNRLNRIFRSVGSKS